MNIVETAKSASRKEFIAAFLVQMTRTKTNRSFVGGLQVKRQRKGGYSVWMNGIAFVTAKDADSLYEYAFRSTLNYFVREAETLRVAALGSV